MLAKVRRAEPACPAAARGRCAQLRAFPRDRDGGGYKASLEVYKEASEKSPAFRRIYDSMTKFRGEELLWFRVRKSFDDFMHGIGSIK